jgi:hypothetical protein
LSNYGCEYTEEEAGMEINFWISKMIEENRLQSSVLDEFLLEELFFGMHRAIDIYKIIGIRRLQNIDTWKTNLFATFGITEVPFNRIIETGVNRDDSEKIAAVDYIENEQGDIEKLRILFIENTGMLHTTGLSYTYSYIPVEIDFNLRIMIIKARPRQKIISGHKPYEFQDKIYKDLVRQMNIEINPFIIDHQEALYYMSKGILEELLDTIPGYSDFHNMENAIDTFAREIVTNVDLQNIENYNGVISMNRGVMDIKGELNKMLQNLAVADYLFNKDEDSIWLTGILTIITCIRFNDSKNATARLSSENRSKHMFNSKAFMDLRNSLEVVKNVHSLSIAYKKPRGIMKVKFDADSNESLSILVLSHRNYNEADFVTIWEMYDRYENRPITPITRVYTGQVG